MQIYYIRKTPDGTLGGLLDVIDLDQFADQMVEFLGEGIEPISIIKIVRAASELIPLTTIKEENDQREATENTQT